jgi:hypothetical protein
MKKMNINSKLAEYSTIKPKGKGACKKCKKAKCACKSC